MAGCSSFLQPTHLWERGEGRLSLERVPQGAFRRPKVCRGWGKGWGRGGERGRLPGLPAPPPPLSHGWNSGCLDSSSSGAFPRSYSLLTPRISSLIGLIGKRLCPKRKKKKKNRNKTQNPLTESTAPRCLPPSVPQKSPSRLWLASPFPFPCFPFPLQAVPRCSPRRGERGADQSGRREAQGKINPSARVSTNPGERPQARAPLNSRQPQE